VGNPSTRQFLLVAALALFLRLILIPHPGFLADIAYWKWWTKDSAQNGLVHTITQTGINYPPLYLTIMKATGHIYGLFANLNNDIQYWDKGNLLFLFLIKLPFILADLSVGYLIFWLLRRFYQRNLSHLGHLSNLPLLGAAFWLLNPGVIYNSALWGQTDSLGVVPILLAYLFAVSGRPIFAGALTGIAFFLKAQSIPLILFLYLYLYLKNGLLTTVKSGAAAVTAGLIVTSPFFLTHTMDRIISTIFTSVGYFPYASLYAFNLWWLVIRGASFQFPDQTLVGNLLSYRTIGFTLFWSAFGFLAFVLWQTALKKNAQELTERFLLSTPLVILSMFLLPTEIHERYLLPFFAFALLPLAFDAISARVKNIKLYLFSYAVLSLIWLLNLHFVMIKNYPENEQPILSLISPSMPVLGVVFSAVSVTLYLVFFGVFLKRCLPTNLKSRILAIGLLILLPLGLLSLQAAPVIKAKSQSKVLLSEIKPTFVRQGWGELSKDKSVAGGNLSTWYFFSWKGLGTHANSQIDFNLDGHYRRLETNVGVDTGGGEAASVEFLILGDDKVIAKSGILKKWQYQKSLVADLTGVKKLSLVVTDAGDGINGDHADWLYPTLYK